MTIMQPAILITGASSGIGKATALALDQAGFCVYAGVRKDEQAIWLKQQASERLQPVILDVTQPEQILAVQQKLQQELKEQGLYGLINNAGVADFTPIEAVSIEQIKQIFEVNFFGAVRLTQALIPLLRQAKGRIINIGSVGAHTTIPFGFALCSSKHAIESFTTGLRIELAPWNIKVIGVDPSAIKTPASEKMLDQANKIIANLAPEHKKHYGAALISMAKSMHKSEMAGLTPDQVGKKITEIMQAKNPKTHYAIGPHARMIVLMSGLLPDRWFDKLKLKLIGIKMPKQKD